MNPSSFPNQFRGMQVHAVPDSDKAYDTTTGRKLPWAYDINPAAAAAAPRDPVEKGPFGRGTNRRTRSTLSRSRSKTAEPRREEDRIRAEQLAAEDAVFGGLRKVGRDGGGGGLGGEEGGEMGVKTGMMAAAQMQEDGTEVILYGFGEDVQWAAIDFYERVSCGEILEDYERVPSVPRGMGGVSYARAKSTIEMANATPGLPGNPNNHLETRRKTWSKAALKKKNTYAGGSHWIKVTFDTKESAELACARSPHVCRGYLVYAEPYEQHGPGRDEAIPATQAGAQITGDRLPVSFSTRESRPIETSPGGSSTTATSATATGAAAGRANGGSQTSSSHTLDDIFRPRSTREAQALPRKPTTVSPNSTQHQPHQQQQQQQTLRRRISGAKLAEVKPASLALAPRKSKQSWSAWLLGTGDVIGSTVPKLENGAFDWERAGFYWRVFYWVDGVLGTDFCGMRAD